MNYVKTLKVIPPKIPPKSNVAISKFIDAVKLNNIAAQSKYLKQIYNGRSESKIKLDCLNLLLQNYLQYPDLINFYEIRSLIDEFDLIENHNPTIADNIVKCLVYSYKNDQSPGFKKMTNAGLVSDILTKLGYISILPVEKGLSATLDQISVATKQNYKAKDADKLSIEQYKQNGLIDLHDLCRYISVSIQVDKPADEPLYKYYERLSDNEREDFMKRYVEFSTTKQLNIEPNCLSLSCSIDKFKVFNDLKLTNKLAIDQWMEFSNVLEDSITDSNLPIHKYSSIMKLIDSKVLVEILLTRTFSMCLTPGSKSLVSCLNSIGHAINKAVKDNNRIALPVNSDTLTVFVSDVMKLFIEHCRVELPEDYDPQNQEDIDTLEKFGDKLFLHEVTYIGKKRLGSISTNPYIFQQLQYNTILHSTDQLFLPMLSPPKDWTSPTSGGFLTDLRPIVQVKDQTTYTHYLEHVNKSGQLDFIYDKLNYMSKTPWCINDFVRSVFKKAFETEQQFVNIPPSLQNIRKKSGFGSELKYARAKTKRIKYDMMLKVANALKDNMVYFPHCVDFRGRIYPSVSILSYQDEDLTRALLQFWDAKPLGSNGLNWLKYQLAALYGEDKLDMEDRIKFVDDNMDQIYESARNPEISDWWKQGDCPWQVLMLCREFLEISQFEGKVEEFKSRIPIHLDGSCNGLQHYAALSKDTSVGKAVNLLPGEDRQDIYSEVLSIALNKLKDLSDEVTSISKKLLNRKLIKRPIMTQVYGVTKYGARHQIEEVLSQIDLEKYLNKEELEFFNNNMTKVISNISDVVYSSIGEMLTKMFAVQLWLYNNTFKVMSRVSPAEVDETTNLIGNPKFKPMMWTSQSGFPIIQLYLKRAIKALKTDLQWFNLQGTRKDQTVDVQKQLNGVAPNYIHSLDALHLLLTCDACQKEDIPFVAVHDSFWTNISNVERLLRLLREEFVNLYNLGPLEHLYEDLTNTIKVTYHIVWFNKEDNPQLQEDIQNSRKITEELSLTINECLLKEIHNPEMIEWFETKIKQHNPKLYLKRLGALVAYNDISNEKIKMSFKKFTPLIIPAQIMKPPPLGDLDITEVLESKYFFS